MRDWHKKIIKIDQARNLISNQNNKKGDPNLYVGVLEDFVEFKPLVSSSVENKRFLPSEYSAAHQSLSPSKKVLNRQVFTTQTYAEDLQFNLINKENDSEYVTSMHATSVASIIAGNTINGAKIEGICPNVNIINYSAGNSDFQKIVMMGLVGKPVCNNIDSYFFTSEINQEFLRNVENKKKIALAREFANQDTSKQYCSIINASFSWKLNTNVNDLNQEEITSISKIPRKSIDFILSELFAYGRNGKGILFVNSAGNGDETITVNNRPFNLSKKPVVVSASGVLIGNNNIQGSTNFNEILAGYSNKGKRVDICAPSGPDEFPSKDDINIYASSVLNGGDVGIDSDYGLYTINVVESNQKLTLIGNGKYVFPGQAVELGDPELFWHEVRFIKSIIEVGPNAGSVIVQLDQPIKFTKNITVQSANYTLIGKKAKILIYKKSALPTSLNIVKVTDSKGLRIGVEVYIYDPSKPLEGIKSTVTTVTNNDITIQHSLGTLQSVANLIVVPGQMIMKVNPRYLGSTEFKVADGSSFQGFFNGQTVLIEYENVSILNSLNRVGFKNPGNNTKYASCFMQLPASNNEVTVKSLSYGNYTSRFTGTSAAAPIISGVAALLLSVAPELNAAEVKHILKQTSDKITSATYTLENNINEYNYSYAVHEKFGAGRVNAEAAVQMAINWANSQKPRLIFPNKQNPSDPDIWVSEQAGTAPTAATSYNTLVTTNDQKIYIKIKNIGNRHSFQEIDLRVLVAFTNEANPVFKFPDCWHQNTDSATMKTILLDVQEVKPIAPNVESVLMVDWKKLSKIWDDHNPNGAFKTYILAHIAPFDGLDSELSLTDAMQNKNLMYREIIATHVSNNAKGTSGKVSISNGAVQYNLIATSQSTNKKFSFDNFNIPASLLDTMEYKFSLYNRITNTLEQEVIYKTINGIWETNTNPINNWLAVSMNITTSPLYGVSYKNALLDYEFNYDSNDKEIRFKVTNV